MKGKTCKGLKVNDAPTSNLNTSQCSYSPRIQLFVDYEYLQNEDAEYRLHRCKKLQGADSLLMETKMKLSDRKNMRDYSKPATEKMIGTACFMWCRPRALPRRLPRRHACAPAFNRRRRAAAPPSRARRRRFHGRRRVARPARGRSAPGSAPRCGRSPGNRSGAPGNHAPPLRSRR